jgi:gamma-glutamyltranspeptidase/glutathione hydrolase
MATIRRALPLLPLLVLLGAAAGPGPLGAASRQPVRAQHGMVGSTDGHASRAGLQILQAGGNAVDAAVAVGFALAVTHPAAGNLGGGGFMVIRMADGRETTIDYRETAPGRAHRDMFLDASGEPVADRSRIGPLASGVPGSVAGLAYAQARYGRFPLKRVIAPAIALARDGVEVSWALADSLAGARDVLARFPGSARIFLREDGTPLQQGDRLVQPDLARTLTLIADQGPDAFYQGAVAALIAAEMERSGGLITKADLASYVPRERPPVVGAYRGHRVVSMPPPSAGGAILIGLLQALESEQPRAGGYRPERWLHAMAEHQKRLFARRAGLLGDPDAVPGAADAAREMASAELAAQLQRALGERATPSTAIAAPRMHGNTTHVSVVDGEGNAVALTTTVNYLFGACVVVPGTGILLNDEMDDFDAAPGRANEYGLVGTGANTPAPGKRPLSSMAPTFVFDPQGRLVLAVGAAGGSTIPTTVAQIIVHLVDDGMRVDEALAAPRLHHQWLPDRLQVEPNGVDAATAAALRARGHELRFAEQPWGKASAVRVDPATGWREAASDPRYEGVPAIP